MTVPVLIVFGSQEVGETEVSRIKRFAEPSKAAIHIIEGADHGSIVNREQLVAALQRHLRSACAPTDRD
jgi:hypothetical protein